MVRSLRRSGPCVRSSRIRLLRRGAVVVAVRAPIQPQGSDWTLAIQLRDIARWEIAIRKGKILSPESTAKMVGMGDALASDGDMFGFEFMHSKNPESMFLLISNSIDSREKRRQFDQLGRALYQLVRGSSQSSKYSLGVVMAISSDGGVVVRKAVPGGAAAEAGLQVGDALVTANGQDLDEDPLAVLGPMIDNG